VGQAILPAAGFSAGRVKLLNRLLNGWRQVLHLNFLLSRDRGSGNPGITVMALLI
jgi:hypothetical protein